MKYIFHGSATESKATSEGSLFNVPLFRMYEPVHTNILFNVISLYKCIQCCIIEKFFYLCQKCLAYHNYKQN